MSYDLMVFNELKAPKEKEAFLHWYYEQTKWKKTMITKIPIFQLLS